MKKPQNYYCHRNTSNTVTLPTNYQLIDKIGEGAFGQVFKVFNTSTSAIQVLKRNKGETFCFNKEAEVMNKMHHSDGFPQIKEQHQQDCLIMTLLGASLSDTMEKNQITIIDLKRIAYQCILRLKDMHQSGYVHRDIKPDNLLLGSQNNPHKIYIVDFGLSSSFKKEAKTARKCYNGEIGTIKFCSIASHLCLQQFPKDDLQSLGYTLIYLLTKHLPWSSLPSNLPQAQKFQKIKILKQQTQLNKLCEGISCLKKYFKAIKQLKIGQSINYTQLINIFMIDCEEYCCYSFCNQNCFAKRKQKSKEDNKEKIAESCHSINIPACNFFGEKQNKMN